MYYAAYIGNENRHTVREPLAVVSAGHMVTDKTSAEVSGPTRPNGFPDYQLIYIRKGAGHYLLENEDQTVTAGQVVIFRPHQPQIYRYYKAEKPEVFWVHFGGQEADALMERLLPKAGSVLPAPAETGIRIEKMITELQLQRSGFAIGAVSHLLGLLTDLSRREDSPSVAARIQRVCKQMADDPATPVSNKELAAACGMSVSGFSHRFKEYVGISPREYLLQQRLSAARYLLENTDLPIGEIADAVGFEDALYFSKFFKARTGMSPRDYKNHYTEPSLEMQ